MMAGLLTMTASLATQVIAPNYAMAATKKVEKKWADEVLLMSSLPVRFTDTQGKVSMGHVYLDVTQDAMKPDYPNRLVGEMQATFYFMSDEKDSQYYNGEKANTYQYIAGDDGLVLLDLINHSKEEGNTYQVYGCNSTKTACSIEKYTLTVKDAVASMYLEFSKESGLEVLVSKYDDKGVVVGAEWSNQAYDVSTVQLPVPKK